ncbi:MAG: porin [Deltaproteobacteria bacterium]|nr:porin [Deltaproteobacteria bacterium]MBW2070702.1 porin [Deltaproteobacteria bacterium]
MAKKLKAFAIIFVGLMLGVQGSFVGMVAAGEATVDSKTIERLERLIREQQKQLESLQQQLDQLKQTAAEAQDQASEAKSAAEQAAVAARHAVVAVQPVDRAVTSGQARVKLAISGQINRAVNVIDDGKNTTGYFVDNDSSNTRVRFVGTAKASDDLLLGSRLEMAMNSNESGEVSQNSENSGDFFNVRWADLSLASKRFGKLYFGRGDTASNNAAELDLSRTDVVQYAGIADIAGGMLFRQNRGDKLTSISVSDAFKDLDGLSRQNRVRYDTPTLWGFHLQGGLVSNQRWDASLWWGGQALGFKAVAAAAISDPNKSNTDLIVDGSFSVLHEASGLNLTLSAGQRGRDHQGDASNFYVKGGWLTQFFPVGQTAFGLDYTRSVNLPTGRDDGYSIGGAVVQQFENYGTEVFLQYRLYSLSRDAAPSVQSMKVGTIGARVKF